MNTQNWFEMDGDNTLALDWDLNEDSHVWEIGGFEGRWAQQIWDKFHCHITIFEPQIWAFHKLVERFRGMEKIKIYPFGIWTAYGSFPLGNYFTDGASMFSNKEPIEKTSLFIDYPSIFGMSPEMVDVALMNIEGGEFTLIPEFVNSGYIKRFKNFWCQFHPKNEEDEEAYLKIASYMEFDFEMLWSCYPTAVAWRLK